jgi:hypothetical protein
MKRLASYLTMRHLNFWNNATTASSDCSPAKRALHSRRPRPQLLAAWTSKARYDTLYCEYPFCITHWFCPTVSVFVDPFRASHLTSSIMCRGIYQVLRALIFSCIQTASPTAYAASYPHFHVDGLNGDCGGWLFWYDREGNFAHVSASVSPRRV